MNASWSEGVQKLASSQLCFLANTSNQSACVTATRPSIGSKLADADHAAACRRQHCGGDKRRPRAQSVIQNRDLSPKFFEERDTPPPVTSDDARALSVRVDRPLSEIAQDVEIAALTYAMRATNGRMDLAARRLGLSRKGLYLKRQRLGL